MGLCSSSSLFNEGIFLRIMHLYRRNAAKMRSDLIKLGKYSPMIISRSISAKMSSGQRLLLTRRMYGDRQQTMKKTSVVGRREQ
ncbi:unnamed protein product, partial [Protopolystoma xenopodis]